MEIETPASARPRGYTRVLIALGILGFFAFAALMAGGAYLMFSGRDMAGLEGTWRDTTSSNHHYEFQSNGQLDTWSGQKSWWNRIGWTATWRRHGQQITIQTDRNWDFVGELDGGAIRGKMNSRFEAGAPVITTDMVWVKE